MIAKFCADNTDTRTKKANEITTTADKFVHHISDYPIVTPPIVPTTLGVYLGLTDPLDFLQQFEGVVSTYNWDEPVAYRVFPIVLQGSAREWFHSLQAGSIIGFIDLRDKFLLQFQNLLPQKNTHIECHDIKQGNKETLSALLMRYIYKCQKIPSLNEVKKISGFLHAINPQRHPTLVRRLRRDVPPTFAKVQQETYDYLRGGEDSTITPACGWDKDKSWRDDNDSFRDGNIDNYRGSGYPRRSGGGGYSRNDRYQGQNDNHGYGRRDRYSTRKWNNESFNIIQMLTKMPKEILLQERVAKFFPNPQPLAKNSRRDKSKFCIFHDDYGHDTNRCRDLAELITEAYKQGKLEHLIAQGAVTTANAIILPAESNAPWQCPAITFTPANLSANLDKSVVVSCRIANTGIVIMKVYIDTGSSVDIMYEQCFGKLPANIKALMKPTAVSLAGFSGESTWPIGQLELHIELVDNRDEMLRCQALLNLYIMRNQSQFNMILGCTALRMFGAIPSTIHGMVEFSANKGIGTLTSVEVEPFLCHEYGDRK
ncbi:uncharacterized protein [Rutidosis leptorrhynchoides]|uniref:uncharacterized protein n=1 Tax=Rutidosis leptorrhynchoides TaxID=125765 RepID=UPI003A9A08AE